MSLCAPIDFARGWPAVAARLPGKIISLVHTVNQSESRQDDPTLLRRIAAGDRAAFAEFYDRHATLMFSVAVRILNDAGEAEDVLQETFLQIWDKAANFNPDLGKASSWAAILARNKAIDKIRASQRRSRLAAEAGREYALAGETDDTANEAIHGHDKARLIRSAIGELPLEQRQAIELAYFSGLTQDEIARQLNAPLGTVKARIRRGLLKLRDQLEDWL